MKSLLMRFHVVAVVLALLTGYCACRWLRPYRAQPERWQMAGEWITTADATGAVGYYRTTVNLPANVSNAWISIAACDTHELIVNGQILAFQSLWRPNRSFQATLSERGQRLNSAANIPGMSYPRDYQWKGYANYRLPVLFDLGCSLRPGRNVICIRIDSRTTETRLCVEGEILLQSGQRIVINSGETWKASVLPRRDAAFVWTDLKYSDETWPSAKPAASPGESYRTFDPDVFRQPFQGRWLRASGDSQSGPVWFETSWFLDEKPKDAWIRLITNRAYDLYINGRKAVPPSLGATELAASNWIVHTRLGKGTRTVPEVLDPDDAASLFASDRDEEVWDAPSTTESVGPSALLRDRQEGTCDAYSIGTMLRKGDNEVIVRLISRDTSQKWRPQLALDAQARGIAGERRLVSTGDGWHARIADVTGGTAEVPVVESGRPDATGASAPKKHYLGACYSVAAKVWSWTMVAGASMALVVGLAVFFVRRKRDEGTIRKVTGGMAIAATVLACAIVLDCCFAVRDEGVWMMWRAVWLGILLLAGGCGLLAASTFGHAQPVPMGDWFKVHGFTLAMSLVLLVCGLSRAYRVEFQPTDADDWASLQTIMAIVDTGTPKLIDDVFYTRSPLYHYTVAASVAVFGKNFWALRLPSACFAIATCALIYLCGKNLLSSRWVGLGAAGLFASHPLGIDIGHQIRFYQQQQFFALLTLYYFCRGFVSEQQVKFRYLTLAAFFTAVFSQEISVIIGVSLMASYLLFAQKKDWRTETKWLIAAGCGMVFVVLDFVIFQTVCLTKVEGVSPSIEPALKLNLMYPSKLYWIFSLFARLHFGLSAVFFVGLPFALRSRERNVVVFYLTFFAGIVLSTVLITGSGMRFQFWLFPIFFLLAVYGARELAAFAFPLQARESNTARFAMAAMIVTMVGLSWSPWKVPGSYATKILPDADGAFAYVRQNVAPDDAVAVTAPHTAAALMEVGRVDYDIEIPMLNDFVYRKDGRLIDRNAGAEVIGKLDDLQDACARHQRLWVVLNRDLRLRSPGERIAWQEAGGRFDLFVRTNLELKHQTYLTDVYLWDGSKGRLRGFRRDL